MKTPGRGEPSPHRGSPAAGLPRPGHPSVRDGESPGKQEGDRHEQAEADEAVHDLRRHRRESLTLVRQEQVERWRPVPGWESAYEVSSLGRVRSVDRVLSDGRAAGGVILARSAHRYPQVTLSDSWRTRRVAVHKLVKLAFTGPPRGRQVRHLNDNPQDCRLANLKYGDRKGKQNWKDRKRNQEKRERKRRGERGREGINREEGPAGYWVPQVVDRAVDRS
jgi:NUMOD4 motif-containing protein/HNH endonuclease